MSINKPLSAQSCSHFFLEKFNISGSAQPGRGGDLRFAPRKTSDCESSSIMAGIALRVTSVVLNSYKPLAISKQCSHCARIINLSSGL